MKALIIGLDGGTFSVLDPLVQTGHMPHLEAAFKRGRRGELLSTIPPTTALAWPAFFTGRNPGRHGILSWQAPMNSSLKRLWNTGSQVSGPKLWDLAGRAGLKTVVLNVPVTYPPEPVHGAMVTGMLTPSLKSDFTFPPELKTELLTAVPDYQIDLDVQRTYHNATNLAETRRFLDTGVAVTRSRGMATRWLLEMVKPDIAMVVFELPDRLQHLLWRHVEKLPGVVEGVRGADLIRDGLLACYRALDDEIGRLVEGLSSQTYLVMLSDHGFGPLHTSVHINDWLEEQGWLAYQMHSRIWWRFLRRAGSSLKTWLPSALIGRGRQSYSVLDSLDWKQTRAYGGLSTEMGILVNLHGREPIGIVDQAEYESLCQQISEMLLQWRDPRTCEPIVRAVYRREELYTGPFTILAPDLVFELERGYTLSEMPSQGGLLEDLSHTAWGGHEREGFFALSGPGIEPASWSDPIHMVDLLPTLLFALGLSVPEDMDGVVRLELFLQAYRTDHPVAFEPPWGESRQHRSKHLSPEEGAAIEERLRGLGYLD